MHRCRSNPVRVVRYSLSRVNTGEGESEGFDAIETSELAARVVRCTQALTLTLSRDYTVEGINALFC